MPKPSALSVEEFEAALTGQAVQSLQILVIALTIGPLAFGMVVVSIYAGGPPEGVVATDADAATLNILSIAHAVLALTEIVAASILSASLLRRMDQERDDPAAYAVGQLRALTILRLALFEGAALFGWVILFLGTNNGVLHERPILWANVASTVLLLGFVGLTFPHRQRLIDLFRTQIAAG